MSRLFVLVPLAVLSVALSACGDGGRPAATSTVNLDPNVSDNHVKKQIDRDAKGVGGAPGCRLMSPAQVERVIARAGVKGVHGLRAEANDSLNLSICRYTHGPVNVRVLVDGAARAVHRYWDQEAEAQEKWVSDPGMRPREIRHVGDDAAFANAGAFWTRVRDALVAQKDDRILRITMHVPGQPERVRKAAAADLARAFFARLHRS